MKDNNVGTGRISGSINDKAGLAAVLPACLLCFVTLLMLILDIMLPSMNDGQYLVYPLSIRLVSLAGIICMGACFGHELDRGFLRPGAEDLFFIAFAVWIVISTLINGINHDAVFGIAYRYVGVYDLMIYIFVYRFCSKRVCGAGSVKVFFLFFMIAADFIAAAFFFNCLTGKIDAFNGKLEPSAVFFHGNHYGYFIVMVIAVAAGCYIHYDGRMKAVGAISFLTGMAALALNRSMGCIIAVATVLTLIIVINAARGGTSRKRVLIMASFIMIAAVAAVILLKPLREDILETAAEIQHILSGDNNIYAGNGRWGMWQYVAGIIADYPVWGYGCEGIASMMLDYALTANPHNEPLTYAAFFGIPAAVFYCSAVLITVFKGIGRRRECRGNMVAAYAAAAYFISSIFGVAMFYTAPFMFVFLGVASSDTCD